MNLIINLLVFVGALGLATQAFIGLTFFISSIWEQEKRATYFAALQFLGMLALLLVFLFLAWTCFFETSTGLVMLIAGYIVIGVAAFFTVRRTGANPKKLQGTDGLISGDVKRFDEREMVFARVRSLRPGSEQYEKFYEKYPHHKAGDDEKRKLGGLLGTLGRIDKPNAGPNVAATQASGLLPMYLSKPEIVKPKLPPHLAGKRIDLSPEEATERVKGYVLNLGADLVGIAEIKDSWVYSHRGEIWHENYEDWGKEIELEHKYAVIFAQEMAFEMIGAAPHTPVVMESMKNYAKGAYISVQTAAFISNMGYSATANHLRYYEAILPPLAVDAGLGEVGRLGYLITKEFGPRIRLGAVTTDLPLIPDKPVDIGVQDFCRFCKKCATCCPSQSIPLDDGPKEFNGSLRWKLNADTCYEYWYKVGTDCDICMKVCPWSHARTFPHRAIIPLITRNSLSRRIFFIMDNIFYGKKPKPRVPPKWARYNSD